MPRRALPSTSLVRAVRRYFGLLQSELAAYLGISPELVKHIEAGRRSLSSAVLLRLSSLARLVPDALPPLPAALAEVPAPAAGPLAARRDYCLHKARRLRRELGQLLEQATYASRWHHALPTLLADASTAAPRTQAWLLRRPATTEADEAARYHLLRLQAEALETEAAALAALLAPAA